MPELKFELLAIVNSGEVHSNINSKYYVHYIDAAKLPQFKHLLVRSKGKALNYLKNQCYAYMTDGKRTVRRRKEKEDECS